MLKEATGTAFTAATSGESSSCIRRHRKAGTASNTAARQDRANPPKIRAADQPTADQNSTVAASDANRNSTASGEGSSSVWPKAMLPSCHTTSQNTTAQRRTAFLRTIVEVVGGEP